MTNRTRSRHLSGAPLLLIWGAVLLMAGNIAHPIDADPTSVSRFEFATEPTWIPIHLGLAFGFLALTAGLVAVVRHMQHRTTWPAHVATTAALVGGTSLVVVFGALDGYAVSALASSNADPGAIRAAALAEEAIDSGLAALGTLTFFGLAIGALGLAILRDGTLRRWIGWAAVVIGAAGTVAGIALLAEGPTTFTINVMLRPVAIAGTLWFLTLGIAMRKHGPADPVNPSVPEQFGTAAT